MAGIAKAAKSPVRPCITPEPHAGGKCTKRIGTDVIPEDTSIPVWAICSRQDGQADGKKTQTYCTVPVVKFRELAIDIEYAC
jgi:hypothetical protein